MLWRILAPGCVASTTKRGRFAEGLDETGIGRDVAIVCDYDERVDRLSAQSEGAAASLAAQ